ncbi:hypothetical protein AQUCO_01700716v1 [Aquilegia coerulea]|uniref:Uncharacterized protein n=1 Tax=Aquilegia coerulea TaxID=218851 RepID=A0A2G5DPC0_AQUCA|nr:hypothetical protein AQUCO_01700716v1 [Aquilegia coerulea]
MGRAPCCEKMGLKRGPWTPEEDQVLIAFIQNYGHGNWRALPKQAGLLRCGKSCRLRWTNYLRPDIKRGNFSNEEEETIIKLHEMLGNRWSAIAGRLPGRTDNEIKNVWHTHLKKRLKKNQTTPEKKQNSTETSKCETSNSSLSEPAINSQPQSITENSSSYDSVSPQQSSSEFSSGADSSSVISVDNHDMGTMGEYNESSDNFFDIDESFWTDALAVENFNMPGDFSPSASNETQVQSSISSNSSNNDDGMDFWFDLFIQAGMQPVLPEF